MNTGVEGDGGFDGGFEVNCQKLKELKLKYNFNIDRIKKAEIFFRNASEKDINKYLPNFMELTKELDSIGRDLEKILDRKLTQNEVLEGFKEV